MFSWKHDYLSCLGTDFFYLRAFNLNHQFASCKMKYLIFRVYLISQFLFKIENKFLAKFHPITVYLVVGLLGLLVCQYNYKRHQIIWIQGFYDFLWLSFIFLPHTLFLLLLIVRSGNNYVDFFNFYLFIIGLLFSIYFVYNFKQLCYFRKYLLIYFCIWIVVSLISSCNSLKISIHWILVY